MQRFLSLIAALAFALGLNYALAAWTGPTATPPDQNTPAPLNAGPLGQWKLGGLELGLAPGTLHSFIALNGNAGFATDTPASSLEVGVKGNVGATAYCDENGNNCITAKQLAYLNLLIPNVVNVSYVDGQWKMTSSRLVKTLAITPRVSSSKVHVTGSAEIYPGTGPTGPGSTGGTVAVYRGSTCSGTPVAQNYTNTASWSTLSFDGLDSPATTGAVNYSLCQWSNNSNYMGYGENWSLTLTEVIGPMQ